MKKHFLSLGLLMMCLGASAEDLTIASSADWENFAQNCAVYADANVTLGADVSVTTTFPTDFAGTFDGQGHTLTLEPSSPLNFAPFTGTGEGAVIRNLKVAGTVKTSTKVSGLIMNVNGATTLENIQSTVQLTSSNYPVAGYIVACNALVNVKNCTFDGAVESSANASDDVAGFIATTANNGVFKFENCVAAGTVTILAGWRSAGFVSSDNAAIEGCEFTNCTFASDMMQGNQSERTAGFVGSPHTTKGYLFRGCLATGKVKRYTTNSDPTLINSTDGLIVGFKQASATKVTTIGCYFTSSTEYDASSVTCGFKMVDDAQIASGALCYGLNGDQSQISWYQNLGEDPMPVLDATHKQVFASGRKHCDGSDYEDVTYNNESGTTTQDEHNYENGYCTFCHEMQLGEDGYFYINDQEGWEVFAQAHNGGKSNLNVKLNTDLEITQKLNDGYCGIFDGQGHTITLNMGAETGKYALFGTIQGATVRNVIFEGTLTGESNTAPIASYVNADLLVENVISKVNVKQTTLNDGNCGGFIGMAQANVTFRNCIFAGLVEATKDAGGFVGWAAGRTFTMENCAMIGDVTVNQGSLSIFCRVQKDSNTYHITNCYYVPCTPTVQNGNGAEMAGMALEMDESCIASGALCFALNGDQSNINFYQKVGEDAMPDINASRGQVYANGRKHCDGSDYNDLSYNNESGATTQDDHDFQENGVCSFCGEVQLDEQGIFHITNEEALAAFASKVNSGANTLNAVLEENLTLNMGPNDFCPMIGYGIGYAGTFDGQGHTLNVNIAAAGKIAGVFQTVKGATIRNLIIEGNIEGTQTGGIIGDMAGEVTVENVISKANVSGTLNVGGFAGNGSAGDSFKGNYIFKNCIFAGKTTYTGDAGKNGQGGFVGWTSYGNFQAESCAMIGDIELGTGAETRGGMFRVRSSCGISTKNCAYIPVDGVTYLNGNNSERDGSPVAFETAADGAMCFYLNGNSFQNPIWYQTIGEDEMPCFDPAHQVVFRTADGFASYDVDDDNIPFVASELLKEAETFADPEKNPAQKSVADAFLEGIQAVDDCNSFTQLCEAYYPAVAELRAALEESIASYKAYIDKVNETLLYLEEHAADFKGGAKYNLLEGYLGDDAIEPDENEYPNGSYYYILDSENLSLDAEGLEKEKAFLAQMLDAALNEGLNVGGDATALLVNADFSNGFNGWQGTPMTTAAVSEDGTQRVAESWSTKGFDMYQTIEVPENGVYMLTMNGAYRLADKGDSYQHGAMLYLNDCQNYLQADIEDMISFEEALDKTNCWLGTTPDFEILDEEGNVLGYTTHGQQGAAYAFKAGRYPNSILVNVTDNKLTVGVRNAHAITSGNEWVAIGNIKLTYCGTLEEASDALDATLQSQKARADFMLQNYNDDPVDYFSYPNFSVALRSALQDKVNAIAGASSSEEKYTLVQEIGDLFAQIYECKGNYANLISQTECFLSAIDAMHEAGKISDEEYNTSYEAYQTTNNGYLDGTYTSEEAAQGGDLASSSLYPEYKDGYMQIGNAAQLNYFAVAVSSGHTNLNAQLTADITADDSFCMIGGNNFGTNYLYNGIFDGQGHTLTVNIQRDGESQIGIFRHTNAATIQNVKFAGTIIGGQNTGLVGQIDGQTKFFNVESNLTVVGTNNVGGFAGNATAGPQTFDNCLFSGKVTATDNGAGGIYGWSSTNRVYANNILSIGEVVGDQSAYLFRVKCDGTVGTAGDAGCYVEGGNMYFLRTSAPSILVSGTPLWWGEFLTDIILEVSSDELKNGTVCYLLNQENTTDPAWTQNLGSEAAPHLLGGSEIVYFDGTKYYNEGGSEDDMLFHTGTAEDPYPIRTLANLQSVKSLLQGGKLTYFTLEEDIDLAEVENWTPIGSNDCYAWIDFDGKGHVIKNLTSKSEESYGYPGFFGVLCGNVRNIGFDNVDIEGNGGCGVLGGYIGHTTYVINDVAQTCYVENVWATGKLHVKASYGGGLAGNIASPTVMKNCYVNMDVTGDIDLCGAIAGRVRALLDMENVYAAGTCNKGGIIGGGQNDTTPACSYKNIVVWNNTSKNFGATVAADKLEGISYYDGTNFAELQKTVVAWGAPWCCGMGENEYPTFDFNNAIQNIAGASKSGKIFNLNGVEVEKATKGIYIIDGQKKLVK